jgi:hypothetical protein
MSNAGEPVDNHVPQLEGLPNFAFLWHDPHIDIDPVCFGDDMKFNDEGLVRHPKIVTSLIVLAFAVLFAGAGKWFYDSLGSDSAASRWSAVGGYFQGVAGSAISIGTMISSVSLAFLALQIVWQQERRETLNSTQLFLNDGIRPLFGIARELNAVLYAAHRLLERVGSDPPLAKQSFEFVHLERALENLCKALEDVALNPYSNAILREAGQSKYRMLNHLGFEDPKDQSNKLAYWSDVLRARLLELAKADSDHVTSALGSYRQLSLEALSLDTNVKSEMTPSLLFAGFLIWSVPMEAQDKLANAGAALLLDIADSLPKSNEIQEMVKQSFYSGKAWYLDAAVPERILKLIQHNALEQILLSDLRSDLKWLGKHRNVLEYRGAGRSVI